MVPKLILLGVSTLLTCNREGAVVMGTMVAVVAVGMVVVGTKGHGQPWQLWW